MNYEEASAYIESLAPTILNPDLSRFAAFMQQQGSPQNSVRTIHVAGTNGKGSTVAIIDSVLRASGLRVGRYTGPHLLRWNERFHLNGQPISDSDFSRLVSFVKEQAEAFAHKAPEYGTLTWFEMLTAVAFFWFAENEVDFAVFEVGLGGLWDATNVIERPVVTAITTIDFDHTHILGSTLEAIAREKAGIIKPGVPVVTGTTGDALTVIEARASALNCQLIRCTAPNDIQAPDRFDNSRLGAALPALALVGNYQRFNALIAFAVLQVCKQRTGIDVLRGLEDGFRQTYWPGRFQWLPEQQLILDGAHNVGGARALRASIDATFPGRPCVFVLSFFGNKDVSGALRQLLRPGDRLIAGEARGGRAVARGEQIVSAAREIGITDASCTPTVGEAFIAACSSRRDNELIVATGSFATVKESMLAMGWRSVEDGIKIPSGGN